MLNNYKQAIINHENSLSKLLNSTSIKYSEWPPDKINEINKSAGIYHFFKLENDLVKSLYIGKGGFGKKGKWSLYSRLSQHFQPSQKNSLIGKISRAKGISQISAQAELNNENIYLQWLVITSENEQSIKEIEASIRCFEYFSIAILRPIYTDA